MEKIERSKYYDKGTTGLTNLGNTCFLNSCLQILNHTYELTDFMTSAKFEKVFKKKTKDAIALREWKDLQAVMWDTNGIISPNKFVYYIHQLAKEKNREIFTGWAQNDLSEFLLFMIESMHNSLSRGVNMRIKGNASSELDILAVTCYNVLKDTYAREYSEIMEIFYGICVSEITSLDQNTKHSVKPECFFMLDLPITDQAGVCSIYDCFDEFTKKEILDGENAWLNEATGKKEDVKKGITFWNFPNVLVITLKRFSDCGQHKKNTMVEFPLDDFDISKYVSGYNRGQYIYELYGICNHEGNITGGHYTAFVKNAKEEWINFNDTTISFLKTKDQIITPMAYCLFYRKKNNLV
jgi:ubiquitin carboxyl-terminal hydrolase 8